MVWQLLAPEHHAPSAPWCASSCVVVANAQMCEGAAIAMAMEHNRQWVGDQDGTRQGSPPCRVGFCAASSPAGHSPLPKLCSDTIGPWWHQEKREEYSLMPLLGNRSSITPPEAAYFSSVVIHIFIFSVSPEKRPTLRTRKSCSWCCFLHRATAVGRAKGGEGVCPGQEPPQYISTGVTPLTHSPSVSEVMEQCCKTHWCSQGFVAWHST